MPYWGEPERFQVLLSATGKEQRMRNNRRFLAVSGFVMPLVVILALGCSPSTQSREPASSAGAEHTEILRGEGSGEHSEGGERAGEFGESATHEEGPGPGEESVQTLALDEVYDTVRRGARLRMVYDPAADSFKGIVRNTTGQTLCRVRVEVHLSNGTELGPTTPVDLPAGRAIMGELSAVGETFDGCSAHAETSPCVGGEGAGEHGLGGERGEGGEHSGAE